MSKVDDIIAAALTEDAHGITVTNPHKPYDGSWPGPFDVDAGFLDYGLDGMEGIYTSCPATIAFIAAFSPDHVALMEAVVKAADKMYADESAPVPLALALDTLTAYRKEHGL